MSAMVVGTNHKTAVMRAEANHKILDFRSFQAKLATLMEAGVYT